MTKKKLYDGPLAFVDGVHYPATVEDERDGEVGLHADMSRPLRWDPESGKFRDAEDGEPLHNEVNHLNEVEIEPGSEG